MIPGVAVDPLATDLSGLRASLERGVTHPVHAIERFEQRIRDAPSDLAAFVRGLPELPDRIAAILTRFEQRDETEQVKAHAALLYEVEKGLVTDGAAGKVAEGAAEALAVDRRVEHVAERVVEGAPGTPGAAHHPPEVHRTTAPAPSGVASDRVVERATETPGAVHPRACADPTTSPTPTELRTDPVVEAAPETAGADHESTNAHPSAPAPREPRASEVTGNADGRTAGIGGIEKVHGEIVDNCNVTKSKASSKSQSRAPRRSSTTQSIGRQRPTSTSLAITRRTSGSWLRRRGLRGHCLRPADINLTLQSAGVESRIRELAKVANERGATIHLTAEMRTHPRDVDGGQVLAQVKYTVDVVTADGKRTLAFEASLDVGRPPSGPVEVSPIIEGPVSPWGETRCGCTGRRWFQEPPSITTSTRPQ